MVHNRFDSLHEAQKAGADAMEALMRTTLDSMERLAALNLGTMRDVVESSVKQTTQLAETRSVSDFGQIQRTLAQPSLDLTRAYYRQLYDLILHMQRDVTEIMESHYRSLSHTASSASQKAAAQTPIGGELFGAVFKNMMSASHQTFERMTQMADQINATARANLDATYPAAKENPTASKPGSATSRAAKKTA